VNLLHHAALQNLEVVLLRLAIRCLVGRGEVLAHTGRVNPGTRQSSRGLESCCSMICRLLLQDVGFLWCTSKRPGPSV
jgi:hypothetical protein